MKSPYHEDKGREGEDPQISVLSGITKKHN